MIPSANLPVFFAVIGPAVATRIGGGLLGHRPQPGRLELEEPAVVLDVLAGERGVEQLLDDLDRPRTSASDPLAGLRPVAGDDVLVERLARSRRPSQVRPGYIASRVAAACATIAGWNRNDGHVTPGPRSPRVRSPTAVSTFQTNAAWPCCGTHGWKWSAAMHAGEAVLLGERLVADDLLRAELLEHRGVADRQVTHAGNATDPGQAPLGWSPRRGRTSSRGSDPGELDGPDPVLRPGPSFVRRTTPVPRSATRRANDGRGDP